MTDKQPEALLLADELDRPYWDDGTPHGQHVKAATLLRTQHKQIAAYKLLTESQEAQLSQHRTQADKFREAIATLQSEREANAILTADIERKDALLRRALEAMTHGCPPGCNDGMTDSGGTYPWGEAVLIPCPTCETVKAITKELEQ